jgi:N6-L-threonylcarbamoyladenine synthase
MNCLGIESTAHSFGVGIVTDKGKVLSNVIDTYKPPKGWGIKPTDASDHHIKVSSQVLQESLKTAGTSIKDINLISFSSGPGLAPCLHAGLNFSKTLAKKIRIPVIGVNHCVAHIEISKLFTKTKDPVVLYVSGGNTQILSFVDGRYRCFGESMDIGIGNALDKFGRGVGLEFPAGPKIESLAKKSNTYIELPYTVKGMDLSFSGIVTEATRKHKEGAKLEDVCFSLQETLFAMLTEVTERALAHTKKSEVILTGGVAANSRLKEMLSIMARERKARFFSVPRELAGDNGAMIAWTGLLYKKAKIKEKLDIHPRQRTDEVEVGWIK